MNTIVAESLDYCASQLEKAVAKDPNSLHQAIQTLLTEIIKEQMPELLTYSAVQDLVSNLDRDYQKLVGELAGSTPAITLQHVLQGLLAERVSIRNLKLIVESLAEVGRTVTNPVALTEHVRKRLASQICRSLTDDSGFVPVMTMSPAWEKEFLQATRVNGEERTFLMSPQRVQEFVLAARQSIQNFAAKDEWPALMVAPEIRTFVRSMLERVVRER